jgi:hypothetical protein
MSPQIQRVTSAAILTDIKCFHVCKPLFAKASKNSKKQSAVGTEEVPEVALPDLKKLDSSMTIKVNRLLDDFSKLRGGRVTADMFNHLFIDAYSSKIPINDAGQITLKAANKVNISVFDPELVAAVAKAVRDCNMSLSPTVEGNSVAIVVPKPSKEAREGVIKLAGKAAEKVREAYIALYFNCSTRKRFYHS